MFLGDELVPDPVEGLDEGGLGGVVAKLFAHVEDVGIHRSRRDPRAVLPNAGEQLVALKDLATMFDEVLQQLLFRSNSPSWRIT